MPAILAKKLGMTQLFLEDGTRRARHRARGRARARSPAIRTLERDGYEAVQLAFGAAQEKHLTKPELGHLQEGRRAADASTSSSSATRPAS